jgi:hypothetical protein
VVAVTPPTSGEEAAPKDQDGAIKRLSHHGYMSNANADARADLEIIYQKQ